MSVSIFRPCHLVSHVGPPRPNLRSALAARVPTVRRVRPDPRGAPVRPAHREARRRNVRRSGPGRVRERRSVRTVPFARARPADPSKPVRRRVDRPPRKLVEGRGADRAVVPPAVLREVRSAGPPAGRLVVRRMALGEDPRVDPRTDRPVVRGEDPRTAIPAKPREAPPVVALADFARGPGDGRRGIGRIRNALFQVDRTRIGPGRIGNGATTRRSRVVHGVSLTVGLPAAMDFDPLRDFRAAARGGHGGRTATMTGRAIRDVPSGRTAPGAASGPRQGRLRQGVSLGAPKVRRVRPGHRVRRDRRVRLVRRVLRARGATRWKSRIGYGLRGRRVRGTIRIPRALPSR